MNLSKDVPVAGMSASDTSADLRRGKNIGGSTDGPSNRTVRTRTGISTNLSQERDNLDWLENQRKSVRGFGQVSSIGDNVWAWVYRTARALCSICVFAGPVKPAR